MRAVCSRPLRRRSRSSASALSHGSSLRPSSRMRLWGFEPVTRRPAAVFRPICLGQARLLARRRLRARGNLCLRAGAVHRAAALVRAVRTGPDAAAHHRRAGHRIGGRRQEGKLLNMCSPLPGVLMTVSCSCRIPRDPVKARVSVLLSRKAMTDRGSRQPHPLPVRIEIRVP